MLTDMIVEEEFEIKEEEPWYDQQDLERDLHLAAELGKTLLDRNRELEEGMQQLYTTNQEQLQEIEVDLLRQMNEQHAKLYEQLDVTARELEKGNQRLGLDNRLAQQKIESLTETIDGLHAQVEELQTQVEELKGVPSGCLEQQRRALGTQSVSCLEELYGMHRYSSCDQAHVQGTLLAKEENASLKRSMQTLQTQLGAEQRRRAEVEREAEHLAQEVGELERRLAELEGSQARVRELEAEVQELRELWRADGGGSSREERLLPDSVFFELGEGPSPVEEDELKGASQRGRHVLIRQASESFLKGGAGEEFRLGHERMCIRRAEVVKERGISLLNEVDAQYSALQLKYDELLRHCQQGSEQCNHKAVQTPASRPGSRPSGEEPSSQASVPEADGQQPEYKALFQELFSCIQKTKEDLSENKAKLSEAQ
ncbi:cerebellar degeneration-related protein 2-like isoform X2 [Brienomyrus brachyistius]|uniref:cerebellar degeneration-related protein 2-like isoform X2 n=1 Tax=Brienomyrus brachyistius TaxID=42636 RepID=UPI0020B199B4|nr:cerebellar degeneration-related protein 2-like isoform X2 [Brienomyrus brachyistius]